MFSEYASKFLAQSHSRLSFASPPDQSERSARHATRQGQESLSRQGPFRRQINYGAGQLGFGTRQPHPAPLFRQRVEEDDASRDEEEEEHEREVADYFALQRSRKHFVNGHLEDSSEVENEDISDPGQDRTSGHDTWSGKNNVIKSSWYGDRTSRPADQTQKPAKTVYQADPPSEFGAASGVLRSVNLDNAEEEAAFDDSDIESSTRGRRDAAHDLGTNKPGARGVSLPDSASLDSPSTLQPPLHMSGPDTIYNDRLWGQLYFVSLVSFFASYVLVWLHSENPDSKSPFGDTIYTAIKASQSLLLIDTVIAVLATFVWIALLKTQSRAFVFIVLLGAPAMLIVFSLYPFIYSFHSTGYYARLQKVLLRWFSLAPLLLGTTWLYGIYKSRHAFKRAVQLLELAVEVLVANRPLMLIGFIALSATIVWTWVWIFAFAQVFLCGHFVDKRYFLLDQTTWWLGAFYFLIYLWTLNVIAGIQRATTAATVSQWYFHRFDEPATPAEAVVRAALGHALTKTFGTICLATLMTLLIRLPILLLPRRITAFLGLFISALIPESLFVLTHPTTLTHASIHGQSLGDAARAVSQFSFINSRNRTNTKSNRALKMSANDPHRIAILLLHATRLTTSFAFGFGAWINATGTFHSNGSNSSYRGSLYAYLVGLIAGVIGWAVIGAMEGVLAGTVDAIVVCWESEVSSGIRMHYCKEAERILGGPSGNLDTTGAMQPFLDA